jgi:biopolymer transport protein ExbB
VNWYDLTTGVTHLFALGGPVMWVLLFVCLTLWLLMVERFWFLRFNFPVLRQQLLQEWQSRSDRSSWRAKAIRRETVCEVQLQLQAWLSTIRTLIAVCPLLGLMGTVTGMIGVFEIITLTGGESQAIAGGVYRATVPTMSGLVISLSAQYFSARLRHLAAREQKLFADELTHESN